MRGVVVCVEGVRGVVVCVEGVRGVANEDGSAWGSDSEAEG